MKRTYTMMLTLVALLTAAVTVSAAMADENAAHSKNGGLGFRSSESPIGVRWWVNKQVGLDLGVGFTSEKFNYLDVNSSARDESFNTFAVDVGVPWCAKSWDRVHFIVRPGFTYKSQDDASRFFDEVSFAPPSNPVPAKKKINDYSVTGELELEVFLAENASVSASHGAGFASRKPEDADKADTLFGTFGSNFTTLGFHVYLW